MLSDKFKRWAFDNLVECIKAEGTLVSKEQAEARTNKCKGCMYEGIVNPLPKLEGPGCLKCGCPFATKAWMNTILRRAENVGDPLTFEEIIELKSLGKFNKSKFVEEIIVCPHPDGNQWASIDSKFQ